MLTPCSTLNFDFPPPQTFAAILYDLDGTLANTDPKSKKQEDRNVDPITFHAPRLPRQDLNLTLLIQSEKCYRYTTGQMSFYRSS